MPSLKEINEDSIRRDIQELLRRFESSLPTRVDPAGLTLKSKIPFKALSLKELLYHRITSISVSAIELYDQNRRVPAYILMRSALETSALCFMLRKKLEEYLENKDIDQLDDFLMKAVSGGRDQSAKLPAINVLTCIKHVSKDFSNFGTMYKLLCEYAHPNYHGTLASFGTVDQTNIWLDLGVEKIQPPPEFGLVPFFMALLLFEKQYNGCASLIEELSNHFENKS
ncbi:hypothetical protein [Zhongshania arctica]|uniref:Uncharacterized protein n=1 Tax=Zhongshania arctica TaxID=3238302 RepID=A0ABV3TTJ0_9GAMM